ncbi:Uncharacterised protein [Xylophilus ampelinus]|nr:Uncharacterised protein [Xylophilus ampelinus]
MKLPTADAPPAALAGCPSKTLPLPWTDGAWLKGVTSSEIVAWAEREVGVAPSLTRTAKLSGVFWSAPVAVWT